MKDDDDIKLTPVENEVMRLQGREIGPTVGDKPVRQMSNSILFETLTHITMLKAQAENHGDERGMRYLARQAKKLRGEVERRSRKRHGGRAA